uniref:hypothetical protein n=1 Tax=uncultured Clostridium sp. TaxID=59620 RepID=UPI002632A914
SLVSRISDVLELDIYSVCGNSFYNNKYSYKDYDKFFENILDFLKTNRTDINSIFIEKVEAEIKTINSVKKVISNNN